MVGDTALIEELHVSQPRHSPPVALNQPSVFSSALVSATIFFALLVCNFCFFADRERIDFLISKMPAEGWCPRFERFLCSSAKPKLLILSSSTGFVPSLMSDIKNAAVSRPTSVVELQRLSTHYESPSFLLAAMRKRGVENVSAVHMGIPTANMSDILLLLQKSLAYGKKPQVLLLPVNIRDFLVPPNWPAIDRLDEPVRTTLGDIPTVPSTLLTNRLARDFCVYARPGFISRIFDDARFYFAYDIFNFVRPFSFLKSFVRNSDILRNRMAADVEKDNHYNSEIAGVPNSARFDAKEQNKIFSFGNAKFENAQYRAFQQIVALTKGQGIKLVIVKVPLYPGIEAPAEVAQRFSKVLTAAQGEGVFVMDADGPDGQFSKSEFADLLHLDGLGGEHLFNQVADYLVLNKAALFQ